MKQSEGSARAHPASGRFLFPVRRVRVPLVPVCLAAVMLLGVGACAGGGGGSAVSTPGAPALREPVLEPGGASAGEDARAASLLRSALEARDAGRAAEASEIAQAVVERYPASRVSGRALRLRAETALEAGRWDPAAEAAARYEALLEPGDPRQGPMRLLGARALAGRGDPGAALAVLATLPPGEPDSVMVPALAVAREAADRADDATLATWLEEAAPDAPFRTVVQARLAVALQAAGEDDERALTLARGVLDGGAGGVEATLAREVLARERAPRTRSVRIASVLPTSGSPAMQDFARRIAEGVEVAVAATGDDLDVEVLARDDQGDVAQAVAAVRELDDGSVLGAVGFLEDPVLEAAVDARTGGLPLISPTARTATGAGAGAYSLAGPDVEAARQMARYAADRGFARVAVVHSSGPESSEEADAFEEALRSRGVPVAGRFVYEAGATFFQDPIRNAREVLRLREIRALGLGPEDTLRVEELQPVALFLPVPPEDVELLAPQVTFFGLDTLGIEILGTSGWTDAQVLDAVDTRHTDGVVATAPVGAGRESEGYRRFRAAYETHFRRTLVSSVPALGYDAALLLLQAIRSGAETPDEVRAALDGINGLEGATGTLRVDEGRLVRRQEVVRISRRSFIPAG
ncbi:MAG: penicillin-binding protein activator [Longimicrobiales bacterium]